MTDPTPERDALAALAVESLANLLAQAEVGCITFGGLHNGNDDRLASHRQDARALLQTAASVLAPADRAAIAAALMPDSETEPQWEACKVCGGDHWTKGHIGVDRKEAGRGDPLWQRYKDLRVPATDTVYALARELCPDVSIALDRGIPCEGHMIRAREWLDALLADPEPKRRSRR